MALLFALIGAAAIVAGVLVTAVVVDEMLTNGVLILVAATLVPALGYGQTFTHTDSSGTMFSAEVTDSRVILRERDPRPDSGEDGEFSCLLSRDIMARWTKNVSTSSSSERVCLSFLNPGCRLRRVDSVGNDIRHAHRFSSVCINMASSEEHAGLWSLLTSTRMHSKTTPSARQAAAEVTAVTSTEESASAGTSSTPVAYGPSGSGNQFETRSPKIGVNGGQENQQQPGARAQPAQRSVAAPPPAARNHRCPHRRGSMSA